MELKITDIITGLNKNSEIKIVSGLEPFMTFNKKSKTISIQHEKVINEGEHIILVHIIENSKR